MGDARYEAKGRGVVTGDQLNSILYRLQALKVDRLYADELLELASHYRQDIPILLAEIERLNKIIDSMKEVESCENLLKRI